MVKKEKQKFKKKTILSCLKGKTIDEAIKNLETLSNQGFGDCKIEITAGMTSGQHYFVSYNGKTKCNILVPVNEEK